VGQVLFAVAGPVEAGLTASVYAGLPADPEDVPADGVVLSELHAASVMTADAVQTTSAAEEYKREEFTVVTLHPRPATTASSLFEQLLVRGDAAFAPSGTGRPQIGGVAAYLHVVPYPAVVLGPVVERGMAVTRLHYLDPSRRCD
jgi:hypothetical protein